jgi:hypothetical protein
MTPLISNLIVIALVAAAALVMGRRALRMLRGRKTGCGCDHCPAVKQRGAAAAGRAGGPTPASAAPAGSPAGTAQRGA